MAPEDVFASFAIYMNLFADGNPIPFGTVVNDPTGNIVLNTPTQVLLEPGYYFISYHVSAILSAPGYMQVTPSYNGSAYLPLGIYFRTGTANTTVTGSNALIVNAATQTNFFLTYNSDTTSRDGAATMVIIKLRRN